MMCLIGKPTNCSVKKSLQVFFHNKLHRKHCEVVDFVRNFDVLPLKRQRKEKESESLCSERNRENPFNYAMSHIGKSCQKSSKISECSNWSNR